MQLALPAVDIVFVFDVAVENVLFKRRRKHGCRCVKKPKSFAGPEALNLRVRS